MERIVGLEAEARRDAAQGAAAECPKSAEDQVDDALFEKLEGIAGKPR